MWCPKCQNEYREGITICPECNTELVEELENPDLTKELVPVAAVKESELRDKICKYLTHLNIENTWEEIHGEEENTEYVIKSSQDKAEETMKIIATIVKVEAEKKIVEDPVKTLTEIAAATEEMKNKADKNGFIKASDKGSDYMFYSVFIGPLGLLFIIFGILNALRVITLFTSTFSLIVIFILGVSLLINSVYGIVKGNYYLNEGKKEDIKEKEIKEFIRANITGEDLEKLNDDITPELLYLKQSDYVKECILNKYPDLNEEYADMLTEDYLNEIYND